MAQKREVIRWIRQKRTYGANVFIDGHCIGVFESQSRECLRLFEKEFNQKSPLEWAEIERKREKNK